MGHARIDNHRPCMGSQNLSLSYALFSWSVIINILFSSPSLAVCTVIRCSLHFHLIVVSATNVSRNVRLAVFHLFRLLYSFSLPLYSFLFRASSAVGRPRGMSSRAYTYSSLAAEYRCLAADQRHSWLSRARSPCATPQLPCSSVPWLFAALPRGRRLLRSALERWRASG